MPFDLADPAVFDMALVAVVMLVAVVLFITEKLPVDVVALLVLVSLVVLRLVDPDDAVAGFGNPAVVTILAVFIVSGGLARTGIANLVGRFLLRLAGERELPLLVLIMVGAGILSGFMNDIGVAALMLPVVMDIARRTGRPPSKLLIPLSFAALMGGKMTLIGTAANLLLSDALIVEGLAPFTLFDFFPVGLVALTAGVAFMALVGRHLLPSRESGEGGPHVDLVDRYGLRDRLHVVTVPERTRLEGTPLARSRLGSALDLNVVAIIRDQRLQAAPGPETLLHGGDRLLVEGELDRFQLYVGSHHLVPGRELMTVEDLAAHGVVTAAAVIAAGGAIEGRSLLQVRFRQRYNGVIVLAVRRGEEVLRTKLEHRPVQAGDVLLVQGPERAVQALVGRPSFASVELVSPEQMRDEWHLDDRLLPMTVNKGSALVGRTLEESRLGDAFALGVMGLVRDGETRVLLQPDEVLREGDMLLVKARAEDLSIGRGLSGLREETGAAVPQLEAMEDAGVGLMEVVLSPYSRLDGRTLREIRFRDRFGVTLLAVSRRGQTLDTDRRDMRIRFGDALLLFGPQRKLAALAHEPDFLALTESAQAEVREDKAPWAAGILVAMLTVVIAGWLPISIAALGAAVAMIVTGCLVPREAYRAVEWPAIVLVAGMLPLGLAMRDTGLAELIAQGVIGAVGDLGPMVIMSAIFWLTVAAAQVMPTAVVAVLMAPIVIDAAGQLGMSPHALLMLMAMAVSSSFMTPVGHAVNVLVMGPGGYTFTDYTKVGLPLTIVIFVAVMLTLPVFWPLF